MLLKFTHLLQMPKFPSHGWILFHGLFHSLYVVYVYDIYIYIIYIHIYLFINLSVDELISSFHILVLVNSTAINMRVHLSIQYPIWIFLGYISRGRITVHIVVLLLIFLWNFHTVFHSGWIIYIPTISIQVFPDFRILANNCVFFMTAVLTGVK